MPKNEKLHSIHFLRFVAALAVLVHHIVVRFNCPAMVGAAGVDVFFVISGIVIGLSLIKEESAPKFALKRIIRVMPLYWMATLFYSLFRAIAWNLPPSGEDFVRSMLLWPRFGTDWHEIYFPAWTLTYEMLFYVVASLVLFLNRRNAFFATLAAFTLIGALPIPVPGSANNAHFSTGICLEFCAGLIVAQLTVRGRYLSSPFGFSAIVIAGLLFWRFQNAATIITESPNAFHLIRALAMGIPATLLVVGALAFEGMAWLKGTLPKLGGDISYSIYLSHVIAIDVISNYFNARDYLITDHPIVLSVILLVGSLVVGVTTHYTIELPLLRLIRIALLQKGTSSTPEMTQ